MSLRYRFICLLGLILFAIAVIPNTACSADGIFEVLINKNHGEIPYPFERLASMLRSQAKDGFNGLILPFSRSLQRKYVTIDTPRILLSINSNDLDDITHLPHTPFSYAERQIPVLYVAYTEGSPRLEVISWNELLGTFEFLVVSDYEKQNKPRLLRPDRALCMSCHQSGGPVFSHSPWNEVASLGGNIPLQRQLLDKFGPRYHGIFIQRETEQVSKFPGIDGEPASPFKFDLDIRTSNNMITARRACNSVCGTDKNCWRHLVARSISHIELNSENADLESNFQKTLTKKWPTNRFARPSSVLLDRNPLLTDNPSEGYFGITFRGSRFRFLKQNSDPVRNVVGYDRRRLHDVINEAIQEGIDLSFLEELSSRNALKNEDGVALTEREQYLADPRNPRPSATIPLDGAGRFMTEFAHMCAPFSSAQRSRVEHETPSYFTGNILRNFYDALSSPCFERIFNRLPLSTTALTEALIQYKLNGRNTCAAAIDNAVTQKPTDAKPTSFSDMSNGASSEQNVINLLNRHCASCHAAENDFGVPLLPLNNLKALASYRGNAGATVVSLIKSGTMPPLSDNSGSTRLNPHERRELIQYLERLSKNRN